MRIYGGSKEARPYRTVWHVPMCRVLTDVLWVDAETAEYAQTTKPLTWNASRSEPHSNIRQAAKILLLPDRGLILIDPVDDDQPDVSVVKELEQV